MEKQNDAFDYVINIQGDEPFIAPEQINLLASILEGDVELATLVKVIDNDEHLQNSNVAKVVVNARSEAIYFSRSAIPFLRNAKSSSWIKEHRYYKHIGMYGYSAAILKKITELAVSPLEKAESLEQLRWIENGLRIKVAVTTQETIGIDTPEDLARAVNFLQSNSPSS
jgi:3-deoxy-manno-octulosonate cytidylyltransferase (CMP-KDO synthetase)